MQGTLCHFLVNRSVLKTRIMMKVLVVVLKCAQVICLCNEMLINFLQEVQFDYCHVTKYLPVIEVIKESNSKYSHLNETSKNCT